MSFPDPDDVLIVGDESGPHESVTSPASSSDSDDTTPEPAKTESAPAPPDGHQKLIGGGAVAVIALGGLYQVAGLWGLLGAGGAATAGTALYVRHRYFPTKNQRTKDRATGNTGAGLGKGLLGKAKSGLFGSSIGARAGSAGAPSSTGGRRRGRTSGAGVSAGHATTAGTPKRSRTRKGAANHATAADSGHRVIGRAGLRALASANRTRRQEARAGRRATKKATRAAKRAAHVTTAHQIGGHVRKIGKGAFRAAIAPARWARRGAQWTWSKSASTKPGARAIEAASRWWANMRERTAPHRAQWADSRARHWLTKLRSKMRWPDRLRWVPEWIQRWRPTNTATADAGPGPAESKPTRTPKPQPHYQASGRSAMSEGPLTVIAAEMATAMASYVPDDMWSVNEELKALPQLPHFVALAVQIYTQRLESSKPIDKAVTDKLEEFYMSFANSMSIAQEVGTVFQQVHKKDIKRDEERRTNEHEWNVRVA